MIKIIVLKELKGIIASPKLLATFAICTLLLLVSVMIGIQEYHAAQEQYRTGSQLADQQLRQNPSLLNSHYIVYRDPDPMQIFVSGLSYDVGRWASINSQSNPRLRNSVYSEDPVFAVFRFIDFAFIVQIVLTLFAILFTYDAISGERESGTLQLTFSQPVSRAQYILGKAIGNWIGLTLAVAIPIALSLLVVIVSGVHLSMEQWGRVGLLILASLLLFTAFVMIGVMISALTKRPSVSFLISLMVWVVLGLIIPRIGVLTAEQIVPIPSVAEVEARRDAFERDRWTQFNSQIEALFRENAKKNQNEAPDEGQSDEQLWASMEKQDSLRQETERDISAYEGRLFEELHQRQAQQEQLAFALSKVSPVSAFQLAAMSLANTDLRLKSEYETSMGNYRTEWLKYAESKKDASAAGRIMISVDSEKGVSIQTPRDKVEVDLSDMPSFASPNRTLTPVVNSLVTNFGLMTLCTILAFAGAFVSFLRYDLRP